MKKRIGILTSGGDCAGLNAVIRAATLAALQKGWDVFGILEGLHGLIHRPLEYCVLDARLGGFGHALLRMGGTILGTANRGDPFALKSKDGTIRDASGDFIEGVRMLNLDALIGIGGDGSLKILKALTDKGNIPFIGIPKTIDNDIGLTDAVGFATAVDVATEALDRLQPTAASHSRVMILEVMGRGAGHIALHAGIAGGADVILIPEIPFSLDAIVKKIESVKKGGRNFALIVVAEAASPTGDNPHMVLDKTGKQRYGGIGHFLCDTLAEKIDAEVRTTVLGHVQRGGGPDARDRIIASSFGVKAIELIEKGKFSRMVAWQKRSVLDVSIDEALASYQGVEIHSALTKTARGLGISFGDA